MTQLTDTGTWQVATHRTDGTRGPAAVELALTERQVRALGEHYSALGLAIDTINRPAGLSALIVTMPDGGTLSYSREWEVAAARAALRADLTDALYGDPAPTTVTEIRDSRYLTLIDSPDAPEPDSDWRDLSDALRPSGGPNWEVQSLLDDVAEISGERKAALAEVARLRTTVRQLRADLRAATAPAGAVPTLTLAA